VQVGKKAHTVGMQSDECSIKGLSPYDIERIGVASNNSVAMPAISEPAVEVFSSSL